MMRDRTVHGYTFDGGEIVRYDRSGKWWIEHTDPRRLIPARQVTVRVAVREALWNGNRAILGLPGGRAFDAKVKAAVAPARKEP